VSCYLLVDSADLVTLVTPNPGKGNRFSFIGHVNLPALEAFARERGIPVRFWRSKPPEGAIQRNAAWCSKVGEKAKKEVDLARACGMLPL
jgi:hypothetical protein